MTEANRKTSGVETGFQTFEKAIAANLPVNVYMYWTGYVTHKPWGTEKSWADDDMQRAMRLLNKSIASVPSTPAATPVMRRSITT